MIRVKGKLIPWHENLTVRHVLREIGYDIPGIFVLVNSQRVRRDDWDNSHVPDNATMDVHRIAAGG